MDSEGDSQNSSLGPRKRVRSDETGSDESADLSDVSSVPKRVSAPEVGKGSLVNNLDRIALLDAGAQYGKVSVKGDSLRRWTIEVCQGD